MNTTATETNNENKTDMTLSDMILWVENLPDKERLAMKRYFIRKDRLSEILAEAVNDLINDDVDETESDFTR